eukprot:471764_1
MLQNQRTKPNRTETSQLVRRRAHTMASIFENGNRTTQYSPKHRHSTTAKVSRSFNSKTETKPSRNVTVRKRAHTMASIFEKGNQTTQYSPEHRHSTTAKVSSIKPDRLKRFSDSGEKYFKILIEPIPVYQDKWLRIAKPVRSFNSKTETKPSRNVALHKDQIVAGTYV